MEFCAAQCPGSSYEQLGLGGEQLATWREMRAAGPSTLPGSLQDHLGVLPGGTRSSGVQSPSPGAIRAGQGTQQRCGTGRATGGPEVCSSSQGSQPVGEG